MLTETQMLKNFSEALEYFEAKPGGLVSHGLASTLFQPDARLLRLLDELKLYVEQETRTPDQRGRAGQLLEQIAYVAFDCLRGREVLKSYQSPGAQIDLFVTGNDRLWMLNTKLVRISDTKRGIVVECKATEAPVDDQVFARLCSVLQQNFKRQAAAGVFFSLHGATGFPSRNKRTQAVRAARFRQIVFYAQSETPIVVFDAADILRLSEKGSLVRMLEQKVRDIEELCGVLPVADTCVEVDLPEHLRALSAAPTATSPTSAKSPNSRKRGAQKF